MTPLVVLQDRAADRSPAQENLVQDLYQPQDRRLPLQKRARQIRHQENHQKKQLRENLFQIVKDQIR